MATEHFVDMSGQVFRDLNKGDGPVQIPEPVTERHAIAEMRKASAETLRDALPQQVTETLKDALPQLEKDNKSKFEAVKGLIAEFSIFKKASDTSVANAHEEEQHVERNERPNGPKA